MIMYSVYNSDTGTALIDTVHKMQNTTTWNLNEEGPHKFAINSVLFLTTMREKYVKMYKRLIEELKTYSKAI